MADVKKLKSSLYVDSLKEAVKSCEALRKDKDNHQDISLGDYVKTRWGVTMESFYADLGVDPSIDTIENIVNMPNDNLRWLLPEITRDAIKVGMRKAPIYPNLIAATQNVKAMEVTQPVVNMSDAMPLYTGIAETIRLGEVSFDQKTVKIRKFARGIKIPYEVRNFVSLNVVSIFLQDYGIKMGIGKDNLALDTLMNGDQGDGSDAAAVIGINTVNTLAYRDLTKVFLRMAQIGRQPTVMIGGETMSLDMLDLPQFSTKVQGSPDKKLNIKTPLPDSVDFYVHAAVESNQVIMVDPSLAMIEYVAQPLLVESEKMVSNQTEATYVSFMTGFGIAYTDSRLIIDRSLAFSSNGFPSYLDYSTAQKEAFHK